MLYFGVREVVAGRWRNTGRGKLARMWESNLGREWRWAYLKSQDCALMMLALSVFVVFLHFVQASKCNTNIRSLMLTGCVMCVSLIASPTGIGKFASVYISWTCLRTNANLYYSII